MSPLQRLRSDGQCVDLTLQILQSHPGLSVLLLLRAEALLLRLQQAAQLGRLRRAVLQLHIQILQHNTTHTHRQTTE